MENVANPEFHNQEIESARSTTVCDDQSDKISTTKACIFCEHNHAAVLQEIELVAAAPTVDPDLAVIGTNRVELENIQKDLDELMSRLNTFIDEADENAVDDVDSASKENEAEKQDGPSEKELKFNYLNSNANTENNGYYVSEPSKPPEVNWDSVGPILQKHVSDLQKIHALNQMTNAVVQRIRNVSNVDESTSKIPNEENYE